MERYMLLNRIALETLEASRSFLLEQQKDIAQRLWLRRPASPCAWYPRNHLRNVGLDIPHLLQVNPASLVCSYSFTQTSRFLSSWFICWLYQLALKWPIRNPTPESALAPHSDFCTNNLSRTFGCFCCARCVL